MMFTSVRNWWKRLRRRHAFKTVTLVESMTSVPTRLGATIYLIKRAGLDRRVVFSCPCGCGRRIDLNLAKSQEPHWAARLNQGKISIDPSIWLRTEPCQSHFFVRSNRVEWV